MTPDTPLRVGYIAIVGRPNVGKSTLLNRILGQKVSITSPKPQTTRHRILGIKTTDEAQFIYVDTPGLHRKAKKAINRYMNRAAGGALADVDVVLMVIEALRWTDEDQMVLERVRQASAPVILVVNKVDKVKEKKALLPFLQEMAERHDFHEVFPLSAVRGDNVIELQRTIQELLPEGHPYFPEDQITDRSERFLVAEVVREKLMLATRDELPYAVTVEVERFREEKGILHIDAVIWVERQSQKSIVIGHGGARLKRVGIDARKELETMFGSKVMLKLWVKVKEGWSDNERILRTFGYTEES
ncbi:MAG TPA: GTPase Era [Thiotrichales bacterium]|nr:GTPase Era [Thiotrichales bacterium]